MNVKERNGNCVARDIGTLDLLLITLNAADNKTEAIAGILARLIDQVAQADTEKVEIIAPYDWEIDNRTDAEVRHV